MSTNAHTAPSSTSLTLRLKHHKSTTIIHASPTAPFSALKAELLRALHLTHPDGFLPDAGAARVAIPSDSQDVLLARPRDPLDAGAGWALLVTRDEEAALAGARTDDVGTSAAGGKSGAKSGPEVLETPKAARLKDGAVLAFRFRGQEGATRQGGTQGGAEDDDDDDEGLGLEEDDDEGDGGDEWDVVLPSYEDAAGVVNEGDVGALRNYTG